MLLSFEVYKMHVASAAPFHTVQAPIYRQLLVTLHQVYENVQFKLVWHLWTKARQVDVTYLIFGLTLLMTDWQLGQRASWWSLHLRCIMMQLWQTGKIMQIHKLLEIMNWKWQTVWKQQEKKIRSTTWPSAIAVWFDYFCGIRPCLNIKYRVTQSKCTVNIVACFHPT